MDAIRVLAVLNLAKAAIADGRNLALPSFSPFEIDRSDWREMPVIGFSENEAHIIAVWAKKRGALDRLVASVVASGRTPVIVGVVGPYMPKWLAKRGWVETFEKVNGEMVDCWRPAPPTITKREKEPLKMTKNQELAEEISDKKRHLMDRWARVTRCQHIRVRPSTIAGYESRLSRVERERDAMKEALRPFDTLLTQLHNGTGCGDDDYIGGGCTYGMLRRAREALAGKAAPVKEEQ